MNQNDLPTALDPATAAPDVDEAVVTVRDLSKRYGAVRAVDQLTFSLQPGTITGFLGPNGAGKTTTLRLLRRPRAPDGR